MATLLVFQSPDADVGWVGSAEVVFHRTRLFVYSAAGLTAAGAAPKNWPLRFPWPQAARGNGYPQSGQPSISIGDPTRVELRLRSASLAAPATMRMLFHESNDFGLDSAGTVIATDVGFIEHTWPAYVASGVVGNLATQLPVMELTGGPANRLACDDGGVALQDMGATLAGLFVDVTRYGRI